MASENQLINFGRSIICLFLGHVIGKREWVRTWKSEPIFTDGPKTSGYSTGYDVICERCYKTLERVNVQSKERRS